MGNEDKDIHIKRMADLLRKGATLTDLSCPACASPLFRFKDQTLWCEKDQKKVIVLKKENQKKDIEKMTYNKIEKTLLSKAEKIQDKIEKTENIDELQKLSSTLSEVLTSLDKIKKIKKN